MAGLFQVGDLVNFGRLAWQVYQYGWRDEHNAARQYLEFGRDVRGLAQNLDILQRVVVQAQHSLREQGLYNVPLRWDKQSLIEIIGDYEQTLDECRLLIADNYRYRIPTGPVKNIEWNALVQPNADRLRTRLLLHNSKVQLVLKPFEIDLLCRVRQDIHRVHQDLVRRLEAVHLDVRRLMGVLVPDLEQALAQQEERTFHFLDVPPRIADALTRAAFYDRSDIDGDLTLEEMADAFVLHFRNSTIDFKSGMLIEYRVPTLGQYVNLLKCIWLMQRIRSSPQLEEAYQGSHWPSYILQLENDLSFQCERFYPTQELIAPDLAGVTPHLLSIWPEPQAPPLVDVVTQDELMEDVLDVSLNGGTSRVKRKLQLLRRTGQDSKRFRVNISGTDTDISGKDRRHVETIDFDLRSAFISPLYALPSGMGGLDVILRKDERIARLAFQKLKDILKFQHAITGYEPKASYTQYNAIVSFVIDGQKSPLVEIATVQLWVAKQREGKVLISRDADQETLPSPQQPMVQSPIFDSSAFELSSSPSSAYPRNLFTSPEPFAQQPRPRERSSYGPTNASWGAPRSESISNLSSSPGHGPLPPQTSGPSRRRPTNTSSSTYPNPQQVRHASVGAVPIMGSSPSRNVYSPQRSGSQQLSLPPLDSSRTRHSSVSTAHSRTFSESSDHVSAQSNTSSSGGSDAPTVTVMTGEGTVGTLHLPPTRPLLVLFTQNQQTGRLSLVGIPLDEETSVNPGLCFCSRGRDGASCRISCLQRRSGKSDLEARRFESAGGEADWNLCLLARGRRDDRPSASGTWKGLTRLSIEFPDARARAQFSGTTHLCACKIRLDSDLKKCIELGHRGLVGEVQERYRRDCLKRFNLRAQQEHMVLNGLPGVSGVP